MLELTAGVGVQSLGGVFTEVLRVVRDRRLQGTLKPVFLMVQPGPVAALRIRQRSIHLRESFQEIDESLGVVFGDRSNLRRCRPSRPVLVLPEMAATYR